MADRKLVAIEDMAADSRHALATGPFGSAVGQHTFRSTGVPLIRGSNLSAEVGMRLSDEGLVFVEPQLAAQFSRSIAREGDLVFTCWGTINQVGLIDARARYREYLVSNKQMKLTCNQHLVLPLFLYYWFSGPEGQEIILSGGIGSSVPGFNLGQLRQIKVPLPDLDEQRAIVSILGALDDKIDLNRRMNETLEAMARAIFKDWFVDFGPTRAKMEGRPPYLAPELWALFPDRLDDEGKPEGWMDASLGVIAVLNPESWTNATRPDRIEYLDLSGAKHGRVIDTAKLGRASFPSRAQRVLRKGDTVVGLVRPGNRSFAFIANDGLTGSTGFAALRPKNAADTALLYLTATDPQNIERLAHLADGAAYPAVSTDAVMATRFVNSGRPLLDLFASIARPLMEKMGLNDNEARSLAATRDLLLPKLLSGEVRVRDAEKMLAAVA